MQPPAVPVISHPGQYGVRELAPAFAQGACSRLALPWVEVGGSKLPWQQRGAALHIGGAEHWTALQYSAANRGEPERVPNGSVCRGAPFSPPRVRFARPGACRLALPAPPPLRGDPPPRPP